MELRPVTRVWDSRNNGMGAKLQFELWYKVITAMAAAPKPLPQLVRDSTAFVNYRNAALPTTEL